MAIVRIKIRHDTSTNWANINPILALGEIGFESDTNKLKVGNGTSAWNNLDYIAGGGGEESLNAVDIIYDNSESSLESTNVQDAIDELVTRPVTEIIKSSSATLTTAEVTGTIINNYGQNNNILLTLPEASSGLTFLVILSTDASYYFRIKPNANDKIYLDGTAAGMDGLFVGVNSAVAGSAISFSSFKTSATTYDWFAVTISGEWELEPMLIE